MLHPVILSGGSGRRLWPASRPHRPKPFLTLVGEDSSFDGVLRRISALPGAAPPTVIAGVSHEDHVREALDGTQALLLLEPESRDTAPAMTAAALLLCKRDPGAVLLFLPADHHVPDAEAFAVSVAAAVRAAEDGWIATLGLRPEGPSSAYGYIRPGRPVEGRLPVIGFIEKPLPARAAELIAEGGLWNCGVFACRADVLIEEMARHAPAVLDAVRIAVAEARPMLDAVLLGPAFHEAPRLSFDHAVMEKTDRAVVEPAAFAWSDLGAWNAVLAASERDAAGNSTAGAVVLESASDCIVRASHGKTVALVGTRKLAVIVDEDGVMICDLDAGDQVRAAVDRVSAAPR